MAPAPITIRPLSQLPPGFDRLVEQASAEGFRALARMQEEWRSDANRFEEPGECLLGAFAGASDEARLIGICGLNRDPFEPEDARIGRVRRLYVDRNQRRAGTGTALMRAIHEAASESFAVLQLRTFDAAADAFYVALGFERVGGLPHVTHRRPLGPP